MAGSLSTTDQIPLEEIAGLYWLHLYDHNCFVDSGALYIEVIDSKQFSGHCWLNSEPDSLKVSGVYDETTRKVNLDFGVADHGYSIWGLYTRNSVTGPDEKELAIAGHWDHSGFGGTDRQGAFHAQQMKDNAKRIRAYRGK